MPTFVTIPLFKRCSKCGEEYPNTEKHFHARGNKLRDDCKKCNNFARQQRYTDKADIERAKQRERGKSDPIYIKRIKELAKKHRPYASYRARKHNAKGKHTFHDIQAQFERQEGLCYWCSFPIFNKYHFDHVIPLTKGGSNWPHNMVVSCPHCNHEKLNRIPYVEWMPPNPLLPFSLD